MGKEFMFVDDGCCGGRAGALSLSVELHAKRVEEVATVARQALRSTKSPATFSCADNSHTQTDCK